MYVRDCKHTYVCVVLLVYTCAGMCMLHICVCGLYVYVMCVYAFVYACVMCAFVSVCVREFMYHARIRVCMLCMYVCTSPSHHTVCFFVEFHLYD